MSRDTLSDPSSLSVQRWLLLRLFMNGIRPMKYFPAFLLMIVCLSVVTGAGYATPLPGPADAGRIPLREELQAPERSVQPPSPPTNVLPAGLLLRHRIQDPIYLALPSREIISGPCVLDLITRSLTAGRVLMPSMEPCPMVSI